MHSSSVSDQPSSASMSRSTPFVIVSLSTSTPSQSNNTAAKSMRGAGRIGPGLSRIDRRRVVALEDRPQADAAEPQAVEVLGCLRIDDQHRTAGPSRAEGE